MINASYRPYALTVKGHAGEERTGENLVCAAVSILMYTLSVGLSEMEERGQVSDVVIRLEPGNGYVAGTPTKQAAKDCKALFDNALRGLQLIYQAHPDKISVTLEENVVE